MGKELNNLLIIFCGGEYFLMKKNVSLSVVYPYHLGQIKYFYLQGNCSKFFYKFSEQNYDWKTAVKDSGKPLGNIKDLVIVKWPP